MKAVGRDLLLEFRDEKKKRRKREAGSGEEFIVFELEAWATPVAGDGVLVMTVCCRRRWGVAEPPQALEFPRSAGWPPGAR